MQLVLARLVKIISQMAELIAMTILFNPNFSLVLYILREYSLKNRRKKNLYSSETNICKENEIG